jgi:hypothetical protein
VDEKLSPPLARAGRLTYGAAVARRDRLSANAQEYLDEDEEVELTASGQSGAPQGKLGGLGAMFGMVRPRHVIVTQRNVYVLDGSIWSTTKTTGVVAKHMLGDVAVSQGGRSLKVGDEKIWVPVLAEKDAKAIAERAARPPAA